MSIDDQPAFDEKTAAALLGCQVLVGLTFLDPDGELEELVQVHGVVVHCDETVVEINTGEDEAFTLPPDLRAFQPAPAGEYRLATTGEVVTDPDYTATWTITRPST